MADGTLLGQKRNKKIIENDLDIDIIIDLNGYNKILQLSKLLPNFIIKNYNVIKINNPIIVLSDRYSEERYDCSGNKQQNQIDQCAFNGPLARLTDSNIHLDILGYNPKIFKLSKTLDFLYNRQNLENFENNILENCEFENKQCYCFKPNLTENFLSNMYGNNYLISDPKNRCNKMKKQKEFNDKYHQLCGKNY